MSTLDLHAAERRVTDVLIDFGSMLWATGYIARMLARDVAHTWRATR